MPRNLPQVCFCASRAILYRLEWVDTRHLCVVESISQEKGYPLDDC